MQSDRRFRLVCYRLILSRIVSYVLGRARSDVLRSVGDGLICYCSTCQRWLLYVIA